MDLIGVLDLLHPTRELGDLVSVCLHDAQCQLTRTTALDKGALLNRMLARPSRDIVVRAIKNTYGHLVLLCGAHCP